MPLSAIGGYLGYVGYFCIAAGVALACDVEVRSPSAFPKLQRIDYLALHVHMAQQEYT